MTRTIPGSGPPGYIRGETQPEGGDGAAATGTPIAHRPVAGDGVSSAAGGGLADRARIRRAQAGAIRNLRDQLETTECLSEASDLDRLSGCGNGAKNRIKHAEDCPYGCLLEDIRTLEKATRPAR